MIAKNQLIELGFSDKEASVYLASLELGPATTAEISRVAKINRTTGYDILESLVADGLINSIGETKIQKFVVENPDKVIVYLENKIKKSQEKLKRAYDMLPELLSVYNEKEKPNDTYILFAGNASLEKGSWLLSIAFSSLLLTIVYS